MPEPRMVIKSEDKRLVYGEVYAPLQVDTDDEAMTAEAIEKMAHSFLSNGRVGHVDIQHSFEDSGCLVVESFIARKNDPDGFLLGSWVLGVKIIPDETWEAVKKGELNGFSFGAYLEDITRRTVRTKVNIARRMEGVTEKSMDSLLPAHTHTLNLSFDDGGKIMSGVTGEAMSHSHVVNKTTATEKAMEHSHRMILIDN